MNIIYIKILFVAIILLWLILTAAYIDLRRELRWYKKQFRTEPRVYRVVPKATWQQRFINTLLFIF
jgi:hypothetical protein